MIKYAIDREGHTIEVSGQVTELQMNVAVLVAEIYHHIKKTSEGQAKFFLDGIVHCLTDPTSPLFEEAENEQEA